MIVIVTGLPGSGKSYFASRLASMLDADYINSDRIRKNLFTQRTYSEEEKLKVYEEMLLQMRKAVENNNNVVLY
jgi:predicted kinase